MGKRTSNVADMSLISDVSLISGVICQQIMSCVGDTLATLNVCLPICSLH